MKMFIDSAIVKDIKQVYNWKLADGVTTNPSLMKKAVDGGGAKDLKSYIKHTLPVLQAQALGKKPTKTKPVKRGIIEVKR